MVVLGRLETQYLIFAHIHIMWFLSILYTKKQRFPHVYMRWNWNLKQNLSKLTRLVRTFNKRRDQNQNWFLWTSCSYNMWYFWRLRVEIDGGMDLGFLMILHLKPNLDSLLFQRNPGTKICTEHLPRSSKTWKSWCMSLWW